jgi:hypothetical protein
MALATVTINDPTIPLAKQAQEVQLIARGLELAAVAIRSAGGANASGNIVDTGATVIGSWVYTAVATS